MSQKKSFLYRLKNVNNAFYNHCILTAPYLESELRYLGLTNKGDSIQQHVDTVILFNILI